MNLPIEPTDEELPQEPPTETVPKWDAENLFGPHREICIELDGVRYRLRITRRNRLILQK